MAERIEKRSERDTPELVAVGTVGEKAEVLEERVDIAAVGGRCSGDGTVRGTLDDLLARARRFTAPENAAGGAVERDGEELLLFDGGEEDFIAGDGGR